MATTPPAPAPFRQPRRRRWPCRLWVLGCLGGLLLYVLASAVTIPLIVGTAGRSSPVNSRGTTVTQGDTQRAVETATHFLASLAHRAYDQAYGDLDSSVVLGLSQPDFVRAAQAADRCDGPITLYKQISSINANNGRLTLTYQVSRKLLTHPYTLTLTLQPDARGEWSITNYGNGSSQELDLTPGQHACAASYSQIWITATTRHQPFSMWGEASTAFGSAGRPKQGKEESHAL